MSAAQFVASLEQELADVPNRCAVVLEVGAVRSLIESHRDLLEALQALIADRDEHDWPDFPASVLARVAVAKAIGSAL